MSPPTVGPSVDTAAGEYEMVNQHQPTSPFSPTRGESKKLMDRSILWNDVSFKVESNSILSNVWGGVKQGEVCAILGPSGAGKSSLLNVLSGRSSSGGNASITGQIIVGGKRIDPVAFRQNIAYVMQDDALLATATPREALQFSSRMRLPASTTEEEREKLVTELLSKLGLNSCADVLIGGPLIKGISGGEKKRVSVGVEIITDPSLLFLDEPTSGLDSFSAFNLITLLKEVAQTQCAILCTIHQPSSEVFFLFDIVIYMREGRIFYQGPVTQLIDHFNGKGFMCPENYNPSDYVMDLCQSTDEEMKDLFMLPPAVNIAAVEKAAATDTVAGTGDDTDTACKSMVCSATPVKYVVERSVPYQVWELLIREAVRTERDRAGLIARFGVTIFLNLLFSLIFMGAAGKNNGNSDSFNGHVGAVSMYMIFCLFGSAQSVMLSFPYERPMFLREYSTGTYGAFAYFISKCVMEIPMTLVQTLVAFIMVYFSMELQGNFLYLLLAGWGLSMVGNSAAMLLGCAISEVKNVAETAPMLFVPQILFGGFFVRTERIPIFMRWCQYLCGMKYSMNLVLLSEFDLELDSCQENNQARKNCKAILDNNDIDAADWYIYVIMLVVLYLGFRLLGAFVLLQTAKKFY